MSLLETQVREIHKRIPELERDRDSLRSERDALKEDYERLKRTIEHMEHEYLKAHGGNWGDCKYQVELDVLKAERDAAGAKTRQALSRGFRQKPLRRPDLHHAGPGGAQAGRAAEAQRPREACSSRI